MKILEEYAIICILRIIRALILTITFIFYVMHHYARKDKSQSINILLPFNVELILTKKWNYFTK